MQKFFLIRVHCHGVALSRKLSSSRPRPLRMQDADGSLSSYHRNCKEEEYLGRNCLGCGAKNAGCLRKDFVREELPTGKRSPMMLVRFENIMYKNMK